MVSFAVAQLQNSLYGIIWLEFTSLASSPATPLSVLELEEIVHCSLVNMLLFSRSDIFTITASLLGMPWLIC